MVLMPLKPSLKFLINAFESSSKLKLFIFSGLNSTSFLHVVVKPKTSGHSRKRRAASRDSCNPNKGCCKVHLGNLQKVKNTAIIQRQTI